MLGKLFHRPFFTAYHPDSYYAFRAHPEFDELFTKFTANNKVNNGGDITRLWALILNCKQVMANGVQGDFAELGVWRGNAAAVLAKFAVTANRQLFLFDTYEGFAKTDLTGIDSEKDSDFNNTFIGLVKKPWANTTGTVCM